MDQLVSVAIALSVETLYPIQLSQQHLKERIVDRISKNKKEGFKKALDSILYCSGECFRLSKGQKWGQRLADVLSDKRDKEVKAHTYSEDALMKIERQILLVLRDSSPMVDFPLSLERRDLQSLEIMDSAISDNSQGGTAQSRQ